MHFARPLLVLFSLCALALSAPTLDASDEVYRPDCDGFNRDGTLGEEFSSP